MAIESSAFGKYTFYDCGAFGMFAPHSERWQPKKHGKPTRWLHQYFHTPRPAIDPQKNRIWQEICGVVRPLGSGTTILDVGAYIGTFCLPAALCARAEGIDVRIESFEPGPTDRILAINIDLNGLGDVVTLHNAALTDFEGYTIYSYTEGGSIGGNVFQTPGENTQERIVPARTLDTITRDLPDPLFIKLDTQGHEPRIFNGAKALVASKRACWRIEFLKWSGQTKLGEETFAEMLMREFHVIEDGRPLPDMAAMDQLLEEVDTRPSRMTDLVLIPKDAPFTDRVLAGFA